MNLSPRQLLLSFERPENDVVKTISRRLPASDFLTVSDIACAMDIDNALVRSWIEDGSLPAMNFGAGKKQAFYKVTRTVFIEFLERRQYVHF